MGLTEGVVLIAVAMVMIFLGRPKGPVAPFLQVYIVGQLYVMSAMVMGRWKAMLTSANARGNAVNITTMMKMSQT